MMTPLTALISWRLCQQPPSTAVPSRCCHPTAATASPSSAISPSISEKTMQSSPSLPWAFDFWKKAARLYLATTSPWWILPMVSRVNDSRLNIKPASTNKMSVGQEKIKRDNRQDRVTERRVDSTENMDQKPRAMARHVSDGSISSMPDSRDTSGEGARPSPSPLTRNLYGYGIGISSIKQTSPKYTKKVSQDETTASPLMPDLIDYDPHHKQQEQSSSTNNQAQYPLRRVNSKDWVRDYKGERIDKINFNNVFGGVGDALFNEIPTLPSQDAFPTHQTTESTRSVPNSPLSAKSTTSAADSPSWLSPTPDAITQPTPTDVICGRGGKANSHPGNVSFRAEALKLRSWYESSSKSEKFTISSILVDYVRERGGRFLKRDGDRPGNWLEADANDVRKKASQALREGRMKDLASRAN